MQSPVCPTNFGCGLTRRRWDEALPCWLFPAVLVWPPSAVVPVRRTHRSGCGQTKLRGAGQSGRIRFRSTEFASLAAEVDRPSLIEATRTSEMRPVVALACLHFAGVTEHQGVGIMSAMVTCKCLRSCISPRQMGMRKTQETTRDSFSANRTPRERRERADAPRGPAYFASIAPASMDMACLVSAANEDRSQTSIVPACHHASRTGFLNPGAIFR